MQAPDRPRRPRAASEDALDAGPRQAAASDPPDAADPGILARQCPHHLPGTVRGIVIDKDDFKGDARERGFQPSKQRGDVIALVEARDDDRKLRQTSGLGRVYGPR